MKLQKVLVAAAHPYDEVYGCGATLGRHAEMGDEVHVMIPGRGNHFTGSSQGPARQSV